MPRSFPGEIVLCLAGQQLAVRYRRAWIGLAWMTLVPLATMSVMAVAVTTIFGSRTPGLLGHIFVSMLAFQLFQSIVVSASHSLVGQQEILRRHAVDRLAFPAAAVLVAVVENLVAWVSLVVIGPFLGLHAGVEWSVVPAGFACLAGTAAGLGLLGAIGVVYLRDLSPLITVTMTLLYWATPILYTGAMVPESARPWLAVNPLTPILTLYTDPLVVGRFPAAGSMAAAGGVAISALAVGLLVFRRCAPRVVFHL